MINKIIDGINVKLVIIAINNIIEVNVPKITVPPKEENVKIINPKKSINEVNTMLFPVSEIVLIIEFLISFDAISSFLYLAKK